jgi:hypothetical protein
MQQVTNVTDLLAKGIFNESFLRRRAMKAGRTDYVSVRICPSHGLTTRELKGCCLKCLSEGRSRNQAKR